MREGIAKVEVPRFIHFDKHDLIGQGRRGPGILPVSEAEFETHQLEHSDRHLAVEEALWHLPAVLGSKHAMSDLLHPNLLFTS